MSSIVVVGAGREGKGFLGEVFSTAGWDVTFLDSDPEVIRALNSAGAYTVKLFTPDGVVERVVQGYRAMDCSPERPSNDEVIGCDLVALCVYPEDIEAVAAYFAKSLEERAVRNPAANLTIIACTNKNHILSDIEQWFRSYLISDHARAWFDEKVEIRDTIVRRSVGAPSNVSLDLEAQVFLSLLIQSPISVDLSGVEWMEVVDNVEQLKEVKLYTYNAPHAACAYAGYLAGYSTIVESMADARIAARAAGVLDEAIAGASREFGIPEDELREFSTLPSLKEDIVDYISRVAWDPIRKLAGNERLVGVARFCLDHGLSPTATVESIVDALSYNDPADPKAVLLQHKIADQGLDGALSEVSGLRLDHPLISLVLDAQAARAGALTVSKSHSK